MTSADKHRVDSLLKEFGTPYSKQLGIDLKTSEGRFKWFLASILFSARIREEAAIKTYREFEKNGVVTPEKILDTGWQGLVDILDSGGYTRYDFKTADKLLEVSKNLLHKYGNIDQLHRKAKDSKDLEDRIQALGKGIGELTANIFLRELRTLWEKADPEPSPLVKKVARKYKIDWKKFPRRTERFVRLESALVRARRTIR